MLTIAPKTPLLPAVLVTVTSFTLPFQSFRLAMGFEAGGAATGTAELTGSAVCGQIVTVDAGFASRSASR